MRWDTSYQIQKNPLTTALVWWAFVVLLIIIVRFIMSGSVVTAETAPATLKLTDGRSNAQIVDSHDDQKSVNSNTPLAPLDLVDIKNGTAQIVFLSSPGNLLNLNNGTKVRFLGSSNNKMQVRLENKDLWVQSDTADLEIDLLGLTLSPSATSVVNISKNELFTTITVLQWSAKITLWWATVDLLTGKQLNYSTLKTLTPDYLTSRIVDIYPDSLTTDWMTVNNAKSYISAPAPTTLSPETTTTPSPGSSLILFESPIDESTVETKTVSVKGRILSPNVARIVINNLPATIDPVKLSFSLSNISLTSRENNIIYRTYDAGGTILSKGFVTVYAKNISTSDTPSNTTIGTTPTPKNSLAQVETYKPDNRFKIVAPSADFFETSDTKVKIEGTVAAGLVHHITINDFRLNSFNPKWSAWYYFANQQFGNMQEGVNTYTIRYFDSSDNEIYKQLYVIKKLSSVTATNFSRPATLTPTNQ